MKERDYENLPAAQRQAVNAAWAAVAKTFRDAGFPAASDDRAERLVDALTRYLEDSEAGS